MRSGRLPVMLLVLAAGGPIPAPALGRAPTPALAMKAAGLEQVAGLPLAGSGDRLVWRGLLPGRERGWIVLFGGCGPGLSEAESAAGRATALAAVADLARTPRRRSLEVLLCAGAPADRSASTDWLERNPGLGADRVIAALHLEPMTSAEATVLLLLPAETARGRRFPPAWLVHAALAGARTAAVEALAGGRWSLLAQLAARYSRPRAASGAEPFLAAGVPALALAGPGKGTTMAGGEASGSGHGGWAGAVSAAVRRLDGLAGRPLDEDRYLVLAGRVWLRRDLYWAGFLVWVALVLRGLPGAWRGAAVAERRRRGRRYLPGFAFRMAYLIALFAAPVATVILLAPAALMTLTSARTRAGRVVTSSLALVPTLLFAGYVAVAATAGRMEARPADEGRFFLVLATLALACIVIGRRSPSPPAPPG